MRPHVGMAGVVLGLLSCMAGAAEGPEPATYHRRLLVYRDAKGVEQAVQNTADWARRRREILAGMQQAMGELPDRSASPDLDVRVDEELSRDGYQQLKLSYVSHDGDRVPAYLLLPAPQSGERRPAMLALHQTTKIGKDEPAGLGGLENLHYGQELAQRGYVVLVPDYPSFGDYEYDFTKSGYASGTIKGIANHMRGVDLLIARPEVDASRLGVIGHSLGGHNAMFLASFDERLQVVVSSCGWTPFHDYYAGDIQGWTSDRYMPRLRDTYLLDPDQVPFDFYEVLGSFAPRAFFSNSPLRDSNFDVLGVKKGMASALRVYGLFGACERLQFRYPDCEHDFPPEVRREAYAFVDKILEHQPTREVP